MKAMRMTKKELEKLRRLDAEAAKRAEWEMRIARAEKQRAYYEANRDKIAAYQKAYREKNREKVAAYQKAYREAAREVAMMTPEERAAVIAKREAEAAAKRASSEE